MMRTKILSNLILVVLILNHYVASHPAMFEAPSDVAENISDISSETASEGDSPVHAMTEAPVSNRAYSTNSNNSVFNWRNLLPSHFGEIFEVFTFFMETKWHSEIGHFVEDAIAVVDRRINGDYHSREIDSTKPIGDEAEYVDSKVIEHLLDRTKYLKNYLNAMTRVHGNHGKSDISEA